eukprot:TRINITY_DN809_c0_g1_i2.p1 TRINITY_DN809_c0_g1~~TRINITY_DN809_c0_g1_i2.p1  ORF type:complete len:1240 (+),score=410.29 TRINITY_DN809_c0_g1_i2:61-3780(+)
MSAAININSTIEKMSNPDKDFRFMATHDLAQELAKEAFRLDPNAEPKLVTQLLKLLEDPSNNVQENAVNCLGLLIRRVRENTAGDIVDTLCTHMLNDKKDELRDISNIGLKTVIRQVPYDPPALSSLLVKRLTSRLITAVTTNEKPEVKMCCLDILNDMLVKFGGHMIADHEKIMRAVLAQLTSGRPATRKRAITCLGYLAVSLPDPLFAELMTGVLGLTGQARKSDHIRTLVQALTAISRSVGFRLGKYFPEIVPLIVGYCEDKKLESDDELRENCLQAFESLILRSSKDVTPYLPQIITLCLKFIRYDPNYASEDDDGDEGMGDAEEDEEGDAEDEGEDEGDISDDDDMSWKVRRSATKCLSAVIVTRPDLLPELYDPNSQIAIAPTLIARFSEREENVKLDVFSTFVDLIKQTGLVAKRTTSRAATSLRDITPKLVQSVTKQLKERSVKTRVGAFALLKELVSVLPGVLAPHISALVPGVVYSLGDKNSNSNLKIEALTFLRQLMSTHPEDAFHKHVSTLSTPVLKAVGDHYYRISAEGLRVCLELIRVIRPAGSSFDSRPYVDPLYQAILSQLQAQDLDQEVKEAAIACVGSLVATLGDAPTPDVLSKILALLLDRLRNEITRVTAVRALDKIAASPLHIDLSSALNDYTRELAGFLRKSNRQLRQASLHCLDNLIKGYGTTSQFPYSVILTEVAPLITDADLHITHLALRLCVTSLQVAHQETAPLIAEKILPQTTALLRSSLLQGLALESLLALYTELIQRQTVVSFEQLLDGLLSLVKRKPSDPPVAKQSLGSIAQCIAVISARAQLAQRQTVVSLFVRDIQNPIDDTVKWLYLLGLGEIGRRVDLSNVDQLRVAVLSAMDLPSEELKQAASFALGNIAVGSMESYLPFVLSEINARPKQQYLLLHSLREIIVRQSTSPQGVQVLQPYLGQILPILFQHCETEEEGTRNVVAECLGKLALVCPQELLPRLKERAKSPSAHARATVVSALKYTIVEQPNPIDALLLVEIRHFLELLRDPEVAVRRAALLTLNFAAHNKASLIRDVLPEYLPVLYQESKVRPELIREVDLGPFKHKVDDGLELRKAAFECMYTLLETTFDRLDLSQFVHHLADGLKDHYDIKMMCHLMLIRLTHYAPAALLEGLGGLVEPLRATVTTKVQDTAVKQQVERNQEMIRSALRAIVAIEKLPNVDTTAKWDEFIKGTVKAPPLLETYQNVLAEDATQHTQQDMMDMS